VATRRFTSVVPSGDVRNTFESIVDSAGVERVFGDPIVEGDRTVVPFARVAYGFGFGVGEDARPDESSDPSFDAEATDDGGEDASIDSASGGSSGGGGGGLVATPLGVVEVSPEGTTVVRFDDRRRSAAGLAAGLVLGFLLARALRRR
jgi:uncharacterized spore protein YtfJ